MIMYMYMYVLCMYITMLQRKCAPTNIQHLSLPCCRLASAAMRMESAGVGLVSEMTKRAQLRLCAISKSTRSVESALRCSTALPPSSPKLRPRLPLAPSIDTTPSERKKPSTAACQLSSCHRAPRNSMRPSGACQ